MLAIPDLLPSDLAACKTLHARHGTSYFFATRTFRKAQREATHVLYAFFRVPDDMVDEAATPDSGAAHLTEWCHAWDAAWHTPPEHPVLRATMAVFRHYRIPKSLGDDFLAAMRQDLTVTRYTTYADLEQYMYGSAAVVGIMMSYIIGYAKDETLAYAKTLGKAMQLTNFLRDISPDYDQRGRIYLPQEDLQRFGVTEDDIRAHRITPQYVKLMQFEIQRARKLYRNAEPGIDELAPEGRTAVRLASRLYEKILDKIVARHYDIYTHRARTSFLEKLAIAFTLWKTPNTR